MDGKWNCPKCDAINFDDPTVTVAPLCSECNTEFYWDEINTEEICWECGAEYEHYLICSKSEK